MNWFHFPISNSHSHVCKHHYHIPHSYNYIPTYECTGTIRVFICCDNMTTLLFIAFLSIWSDGYWPITTLPCCAWIPTTLLLLRLHLGSLSTVNMFWPHGLACCQVIRGLLYKANPQQSDILYLYCLVDLKIYNLASIELGNQNHRMHTGTVNSYETHTSYNSTECGDLR